LRTGVTNPAGVAPVKRYLAHVRQNKDGSFVIHNLEEHLRAVADLAGEFASIFGHSDWGQLAGLWHDLGKYSSAFQNYIARGNERTAWIQRVEE
jgi:HD superfamily phosphohydrolase YqeK